MYLTGYDLQDVIPEEDNPPECIPQEGNQQESILYAGVL